MVEEVTYYTPDRRRVTALGPTGDADFNTLGNRPPKNVLSEFRNLTVPSSELPSPVRIPFFWAIAGSMFLALTLGGPFSIFEGDGVVNGIWAGMANTGLSVAIGAGLYLVEAWLARREAAGWAKYDTLIAEGCTASLISDEDVGTVAELIAVAEDGMDRLKDCGLSTDEYQAQMVPLVEEAMLYASDTQRSYRELVKARRMLARISQDDIDNDDELQQLSDDRRTVEAETSTAFARWMSTRWKLENLGAGIHEEADLAEAKLAAARWNAEHGNRRN
ncbi:hypothetical protein [Brevibacterium sp. SMBL_HHYL_HB1]|uniref:hypothetical protein n=1 Tax=Brevibacterium sp. SMBL_HHYL_HB1 TaxID=2777556 RepID=UPI001BA51D34|nr:hypothetical protein [Brevibacterium sp. SMBL_HHYL_HB1]QUL78069.1 hypothetical protein IG171_11310 [Brevibacterium sp. SMBL_HHYL_HB1]